MNRQWQPQWQPGPVQLTQQNWSHGPYHPRQPPPLPSDRRTVVVVVLVAVVLLVVLVVVTAINQPAAGSGGIEVAAGRSATISTGLELTAAPLTRADEPYDGPLTCTSVSYRNGGSTSASYGVLDWTLRNPQGDRIIAAITARRGQLSYGELAPGETVSGEVCFRGYTPGRNVLTAEDFTEIYRPETVSWVNDLR